MYAPKSAAEHYIFTKFASRFVSSDIWVGVKKGRMVATYNNVVNPGLMPLQITEDGGNWTYSDGTSFNSTHNYRFNILGSNPLVGPCLYLKLTTGYSGKEQICDNTYSFVCEWQGEGQ